MLEFTTLKEDSRKLLALTGLTLEEFEVLLPAFTTAYRRQHPSDKTLAGRPRQRRAGGGRRGVLASMEQKLLFILVYQKTYPLQVVLGELFGMSQAGANQWIHRLLPILQAALTDLGVMPERTGSAFAQAAQATGEVADYIIDGTERRRQHPKSPEKQALHYSGKQKAHSDKNLVIVNTRSKRVGYLSPTYAGRTHDKKMADAEHISYPPETRLHKDMGFQGYEPAVAEMRQPQKSRRAKN